MTLDAAYFDRVYAGSDDPWSFRTRWYERRKYALTAAALPRERYANGFEAGCSIGELTGLLAERCDRLLAVDISPDAVRQAGERTAAHRHVTVEQRTLPDAWPQDSYDLVVVSEVGYYFSAADLDTLLTRAVASLQPAGTLVAVHWRHPVTDYPLSGDEVHAALARTAGLARTIRHEEEDFLLEVFAREPPAARSVAAAEGLLG